jgi:2-keto-4-pentenoate hydratase/2-oxohepta-3-ene-1,7-dioic acid hydratase in catechol pathway
MTDYRLLSYQSKTGPRAGIALGDTVYDAQEATGNAAYVSVLGILDDWGNAEKKLNALNPKGGMALKDMQLLTPVLYPGAIYCAGANYKDHVEAMARRQNIAPEPDPHEVGLNPWHFQKSPRSTAVGPGAHVARGGKNTDWEAELALVIGRTMSHVKLDDALNYVAAYTIGNDLSARDMTRRPHIADGSPFKYDWIGQKNFDGACPLGPWLVPAAQIGDPQKLDMQLWVNGELKQNSNTSKMIFTAAEQISYLSTRITLHPGDIILTGTPSGTGAESGTFLNKGDTIKIAIEKIGELVTHID